MRDLTQELFGNFIGGDWCASNSGEMFLNHSPADLADVVGNFQRSDEYDAQSAVQAASAACPGWRSIAITQRAAILTQAAGLLEERADLIAEELTREEGKPLAQARGEVFRSARTLRFYAVEGQTYSGEVFPQDDPDMLVYSLPEPLGMVTVITPWNFPISIPARKIAPALIMGNTVVFKPASDTPLSAYRLVEALVDAGIPSGVVNFLTGPSSRLGPILTQSPEVRAISFTGSTAAGEAIHRGAGMTTRLQMELGGKNPLIVMSDADVDRAVELTINGGVSLTGQACTGTGRVLVDKKIHAEYIDKLVDRVQKLTIDNGLRNKVDIGPVANEKQLKSILDYVEIGKSEATHMVGGERLESDDLSNGYFITPAVFSDVKPNTRLATEEIFGPVIPVIAIDGYDEAIQIANASEYGLSASIVTQSPHLAQRFTQDIESGTVKVNRTTTGNLVNAPFGGVKRSSTATFRESGRVGLEFFMQLKTVYQGGQ